MNSNKIFEANLLNEVAKLFLSLLIAINKKHFAKTYQKSVVLWFEDVFESINNSRTELKI